MSELNIESGAGVAIAIIGNILMNLALNVIKHTKRKLIRIALHGLSEEPIWDPHDNIWWLGVAILIVGESTNLVAYGLAPASVVSPLGVFTVISNCVLPPLLFDVNPHIRAVVGANIALPGVFLLIFSSPNSSEDSPMIDDIARNYFSGSLVLAILLALIRAFTQYRECWRWLVSNCMLSALLGSYSVLSFKWFVAAIENDTKTRYPSISINQEQDNTVSVVIFVVTGILQFVILYDIFRTYPLYQVIPQHFVYFTAFVSIGSGFLFHEFSEFSVGQYLMFASGLILVVIGVFLASTPSGEASDIPPISEETVNDDPERVLGDRQLSSRRRVIRHGSKNITRTSRGTRHRPKVGQSSRRARYSRVARRSRALYDNPQ